MATYENRQPQIFNIKTKQNISMPLPQTPRKEYFQISDRFKKIKFLGKGKYSDVYMAVDKITNCIFAIKIIKKSIINQFNLSKLLTQEIKILSQLNHSNIMKFYGVMSDDKEVVIILECCESSLYKLYDKLDQINEVQKQQMIYEILQAFSYLHDRRIVHRDVKPENIMMIQNHIKIGDFGLAVELKGKQKLKSICGTPYYMAPEVCKGLEYDNKADCYSLGVIIEELKCKSNEIRNMVHILKQNDCNLRGNVKDFLQLKIFQKVKQILSQTILK